MGHVMLCTGPGPSSDIIQEEPLITHKAAPFVQRAPLFKLPLELLLLITERLCPKDIACLTLCSKSLLWALGKDRLSGLSRKHKHEFLLRLSRDLPAYTFCYFSGRLHSRKHASLPLFSSLGYSTGLVCMDRPTQHLAQCFNVHLRSKWLCRIPFASVQSVMKRHYQGPPHGLPVDILSFTEAHVPDRYDFHKREPATTFMSVEARICSKPTSLCLHIQHWIVANRVWLGDLLAYSYFVRICDHMALGASDVISWIQPMLEAGTENSSPGTAPDIHICLRCKTHYQIEVCAIGDEDRAVVVTKWLDVGAGLTPKDVKWQVHLPHPDISGLPPDWNKEIDTRMRFEREPGISQRALLGQTAPFLKGDRFKQVMTTPGYGIWYHRGVMDSRVLVPD